MARPDTLRVEHLRVEFAVPGGVVQAVRDVSFRVGPSECLCIVGESGSGKSVTLQSVMGLLPVPPARVVAGNAWFQGRDLLALPERERREVCGRDIAMIFQDPLTSLNPTMSIGAQLEEPLILHTEMDSAQRRKRIAELLDLVRIPDAAHRVGQFPHDLSGGMRQRVMIAMALACTPKLLIADEPTTALDVTIQAQILALMKELAREFQMATVLITHDLGVVAQMADRVAVMYAGQIREEGSVDDVLLRPAHPYTVGLKEAMPKESGGSAQRLVPIPGSPPDLFAPPPGCAFSPRCSRAMALCHEEPPPEIAVGPGRTTSCWLYTEEARSLGIQGPAPVLGRAES